MKHAPVFLLCLAWSLVAAIPLIEPAVNENFNVTLEVADVAAAKINNIPGKSCRCGGT